MSHTSLEQRKTNNQMFKWISESQPNHNPLNNSLVSKIGDQLINEKIQSLE